MARPRPPPSLPVPLVPRFMVSFTPACLSARSLRGCVCLAGDHHHRQWREDDAFTPVGRRSRSFILRSLLALHSGAKNEKYGFGFALRRCPQSKNGAFRALGYRVAEFPNQSRVGMLCSHLKVCLWRHFILNSLSSGLIVLRAVRLVCLRNISYDAHPMN